MGLFKVCAALAVALGAAVAGCSGQPSAASSSASPAAGPAKASLVVHTADGSLRGTADGSVLRFRGIPYAQPPAGALRWAPPQPVRPWSGVRAAGRSRPPCAQPGKPPQGSTSEDCLHLDITTPATRPAQGHPLPVLVFLHGGGFTSGTGTDYDPARMVVRSGIVVVTVDFRLGIMGNLALPGMADGGTFGLQDQQAALRWLKKSVSAFGGDPGNMTLAGQSGGAVAVCGQLTSPGARGLFAKAILMSGSCGTTLAANASGPGTPAFGTFWRPLAAAAKTGTGVAAALGCPDPATALSCLRRVPVSRLLAQDGAITAAAYGGTTLPADPATATAAQPGRPVLSGNTLDEQRLIAATYRLEGKPITAAQYPGLLRAGFGARATAVARQYPASAYGSAELAWAAAYTDSGFVCPQLSTDSRLAQAGPVYGYEFADQTAPPLIPATPGFAAGASHASDLFYLFAVRGAPLHLNGSVYGLTAKQQALAGVMTDAWTAFARTGTPGAAGVPGSWPQWSGQGSAVHQFTADAAQPRLAVPADEHHCAFWQATNG
jgi:para-nitrobenzyl esterase